MATRKTVVRGATTTKKVLNALDNEAVSRKVAFKELCDHVAKGYSLDSFPLLCKKTIEKYFLKYPEEFVRDDFEKALRKGRLMWEDIGVKQSLGTCLGNSRTWYYNMCNRYSWAERSQIEAEHKGNLALEIVSYATLASLDSAQEKDGKNE